MTIVAAQPLRPDDLAQLARRDILTVAIANTVAVSDIIDCRDGWIGFLHLGSAIDGADVRFLMSEDGADVSPTWEPIVDDAGVEVKITATVAVWIALPASIRDLLRLVRWVQLETETGGAPTVQTADRSLKVGIIYM